MKWTSEGRPVVGGEQDRDYPLGEEAVSGVYSYRVIDSSLCINTVEYMHKVAHDIVLGINHDIQVIDARSAEYFSGVKKYDTPPGMRSGHISGSINVHYKLL